MSACHIARPVLAALLVAVAACAPAGTVPKPAPSEPPSASDAPSPVANEAPAAQSGSLDLAGGTGDCAAAAPRALIAMNAEGRTFAVGRSLQGAASVMSIFSTLSKVSSVFSAAHSGMGIYNGIMDWTGNGANQQVLDRLDQLDRDMAGLRSDVARIENRITQGFDEVVEGQWNDRQKDFANSWASLLSSYDVAVVPKSNQLETALANIKQGQGTSDQQLKALANAITSDVGAWSTSTWDKVLADEFGKTSYSVSNYGQIVAYRTERGYGGAWGFGDLPYYSKLYGYATKLLLMQIEATRLLIAAHTYLGESAAAEAASQTLTVNGRRLLQEAGWPLDLCDGEGNVVGLVNRIGTSGRATPGPVEIWPAAPNLVQTLSVNMGGVDFLLNFPGGDRTGPVSAPVMGGLPSSGSASIDLLASAVPAKYAGDAAAWMHLQGFSGFDKSAKVSAPLTNSAVRLNLTPAPASSAPLSCPSKMDVYRYVDVTVRSLATGGSETVHHLLAYGCRRDLRDTLNITWEPLKTLAPIPAPFPLAATRQAMVNPDTNVLRPATDDYIGAHLAAFVPTVRPAIPQLLTPTVRRTAPGQFNVTLQWTKPVTSPTGYEVFDLAHPETDPPLLGGAAPDGPNSVAIVPGDATSIKLEGLPLRAALMLQVLAFEDRASPSDGPQTRVYSWPSVQRIKLAEFASVPKVGDIRANILAQTATTSTFTVAFEEPAVNAVATAREYRIDGVATGDEEPVHYTDWTPVLPFGRTTSPEFVVPRGKVIDLRLRARSKALDVEAWVDGGAVDFTLSPDTL